MSSIDVVAVLLVLACAVVLVLLLAPISLMLLVAGDRGG